MIPGFPPAASGGELPRELALLLVELGGQDDLHRRVEAAVPAVRARHPLAREPDGPAVLRLRRDPQRDLALERWHDDLPAEQRLVERDRQLDAQIVAVAREDRMRLHSHAKIGVTGRPAVRSWRSLTGQPDALTVTDTRGDLHREPLRRLARTRDLNDLLGPLVRLGQRHLDLGLDVLAAPCAPRGPRAGASEQIVRLAGEPAVRG